MNITSPTETAHRALIADLYAAVDRRDAQAVGSFVSKDARFQIGNFDEIQGRQSIIDANADFFATIKGMEHGVDDLWSVDQTAFCTGRVHYTRKDDSTHDVPFATVLNVRGEQISDYRVFVDISAL